MEAQLLTTRGQRKQKINIKFIERLILVNINGFTKLDKKTKRARVL